MTTDASSALRAGDLVLVPHAGIWRLSRHEFGDNWFLVPASTRARQYNNGGKILRDISDYRLPAQQRLLLAARHRRLLQPEGGGP